MLLGPCLAAMTAPAAAPDAMEFQGSWDLMLHLYTHPFLPYGLLYLLAPDVSKCAVKGGEAYAPGSKLTSQQWGPKIKNILATTREKNMSHCQRERKY